jgi:Anti-sigma-K factor rskA
MTTPDTDLDSLLGAYALDALDDIDRARVDRYLVTSPRARAEVDEHLHVAMMLGNSAGPAPLALWDRIDKAVVETGRADTPFEAARLQSPRKTSTSGAATSTRIPSGANVAAIRRPSFGVGAAAAACVAAIVAISSVTFSQTRRINELQATVSRTNDEAKREQDRAAKDQKRIATLERELTNAGTADARVAQMLSASTGRVVELIAGKASVGRVVFDPGTGEGFIIPTDLHKLTNGHTYQLWGVQGDTVLSLGVLGQDPATRGFAADGSWSSFVLTEEASPGVASSKQPAFAVAKVVTA